jgi:hypothetical protein
MRSLARFSRPLNALFALWFAIVLGDPGVLHACPMHGGGHGAGHAATAPAAPTGHEGHAMHGAPAAEQTAPGATQQSDTPAPCTCVGSCSAASTATPVPVVAAVHVPEAVAEVRRPLAAPSVDAPASPALRLPFANGPPTA